MKLKHWQGYGTVNARKIKSVRTGDCVNLVVEVTGNHEWGIVREDPYDVHRWLMARFAKDCPDYRNIRSLKVTSDVVDGVDRAVYDITYRPA